MAIFKIHPGIGIARLGNTDEFYLAPEQLGALPIECDDQGREKTAKGGEPVRVQNFKESGDLSKIKRQGARFRVFAYDDENDPDGREIKIGDTFTFELETTTTGRTLVEGRVKDVQWTVHLANKKSSWYDYQETDGMHGYSSSHPLRNPTVTQPDLRRQLITDPGPQTVSLASPNASFAKGENPGYPQTFPPETILPNPITTLGDLIVNEQNKNIRLIVLGGQGNSGSTNTPYISSYTNNDGWFDDISDGPVTAVIEYDYDFSYTTQDEDGNVVEVTECRTGTMEVNVPAWVVVGYPRYVPEIPDMITLDEVIYDLSVRNFAYEPRLFGVPPYDKAGNSPKTEEDFRLWRNEAQYNPDYYPKFYKEIWPILLRPDLYRNLFDFDFFAGGDPHNTGTGGNLDEEALSMPPMHGEDPNFQHRQFIYKILRQPGQENLYTAEVVSRAIPDYHPRLMPMLAGNNPISNTSPEKFLRLTDTQLFLLGQWARGKFVNECIEWGEDDPNCKTPWKRPAVTGSQIDRGVLGNMLGGAFCPGGELGWIVLNTAIYSGPYRFRHTTYTAGALSLPAVIADQDGSPAANLAAGLEPGDLTKYIGIPWQADFHECSYQTINITYEGWNKIYPDSTGDPVQQEIADNIPWWPAHRPTVVLASVQGPQVYWASGIPDNNAGDLEMVTAWKDLGFIKYVTKEVESSIVEKIDGKCKKKVLGTSTVSAYSQVERNDAALGPPVRPGSGILGEVTKSADRRQ